MPLQAIIVNTIFDLPVVENGASTEEIRLISELQISWKVGATHIMVFIGKQMPHLRNFSLLLS
jgi:hypothetical protein